MPLTVTYGGGTGDRNNVIYAYDYGVRADGATPSAVFLQNAMDAASSAQLGTVLVPGGAASGSTRIKMQSSVEIPSGVRVVGTGRRGTTFDAISGTFPTSTAMFNTGTTDLVFDVRLENLSIDMKGIAGSHCVTTQALQEGCGLFHVGLYGASVYGWNCIGGQNFHGYDLEVYNNGGSTAGINFNGSTFFSMAWATVNTFNAGASGYGVRAAGCTNASISQIHSEQNLYGVYVDSGSIDVDVISGSPDGGTTLYITGASNYVNATSIHGGGGVTTLNDISTGYSTTDTFVQHYCSQKMRLGMTGMASGTAAPTTGAHVRGEIVWNYTPSASGPPGWVCVTAGTPGTWKAMANLAA